MARWIQQKGDRCERGHGEPPVTGDVHFVDELGSKAIIKGRLYINGQPAAAGSHEIDLPDLPPGQALVVDVDAKGLASKAVKAKKPKPPKGGP